jgi:hypothetical protein
MQSLPIVLIVEDDHLIWSVVEEAPTERGIRNRHRLIRRASHRIA